MLTKKLFPIPLFFISAVFLALCCAKDSGPLEPPPHEEPDTLPPEPPDTVEPQPPPVPENPLAFFPLKDGFKAVYIYFDNYEYYNETGTSITNENHRYDGWFILEVNSTQKRDSLTFFQLSATWHIDREEYARKEHYYDGIWKVRLDSSFNNVYTNSIVTTEYILLYDRHSLWYVENTQDFDLLNSDSLTLMMEDPQDTVGKINLKLFDFPGTDYFSLIMEPYWWAPTSSFDIYFT